jgi:GAF domain-containing protein/anti-sigma regulatory factor (Ser/Thr protein kinase)
MTHGTQPQARPDASPIDTARQRDLALLAALSELGGRAAGMRDLLEGALAQLSGWLGTDAAAAYLPDADGGPQLAALHGEVSEFGGALQRFAVGVVAGSCDERVFTPPDPEWDGLMAGAMRPASCVITVVPRARGEVQAVFVLPARMGVSLPENPTEVLGAAAPALGLAIAGLRLQERLRAQSEQAAALTYTGRAVTASLDVGQTMRSVISAAVELTHSDAGAIAFVDEERDALEFVAALGVQEGSRIRVGARLPLHGTLIGRAVLHGEPVLFNDLRAQRDRPDGQDPPRIGVNALLAMPLRAQERSIGVLALGHNTPGYYRQAHLELLGGLAVQAAVAVENARLFEAEHRRREQAEALQAAGLVLASKLDLDALLGTILDQLRRVVPYDSSAFFLPDGDRLYTVAARGFDLERRGYRVSPEPGTLLFEIAQTGRPLIVDDVRGDPRWQPTLRTENVRSWMGIPLIANEQLVGFLTLDRHEAGWYGADHARLAAAFAAQAAIAVKNAELFRDSREHASRLQALYDVGRLINSSVVELQTVIETVVRSATEQTSFPMAALALVQPRTQTLTFVSSNGMPDAYVDFIQDMPLNSPQLKGSAIERAMTSNELAVVEDVRDDPRAGAFAEPLVQAGLLSYVCVPLLAKGRFEGALAVYDHRPRPDAAGDLSHLAALADQAAVAIANARLYESMDEGLRQMRALQRLTSAVAASLDLQELLDLSLSAAMRLFGADRAGIFLSEPSGSGIHSAAARGLSNDYLDAVHARYRDESGDPAQAPEQMYVADARTDPRMAALRGAVLREGFRSMLFSALRYRNEQIGVFVLYHDQIRAYSDGEIALVRTFADQAAIAIEHARLFEDTRRLAVVEERNRLARELHDSVTQSLFSMSLMTQALPRLLDTNPARARERLDRLGELARGALAEMRSLIFELRPAALEEEGLVSAIGKYAAAFESREGVRVVVHVDGERRLPIEQEETLFRITQEALNNVAKHARATSVIISLRFDADASSLEVRDDGVGFDTTAVVAGRRGFGMTSMRDRAALLRGETSVESEPGRGTTVLVRVPSADGTGA